MQKIKLNNGREYEVLSCGASVSQLVIELPKTSYITLADLAENFSDANNTSEINLYDESGDLVRTPYLGYTTFFKVEFVEGQAQIESVDRYVIVLNYTPRQYATQDDVDILSDAIAELAELIAELEYPLEEEEETL